MTVNFDIRTIESGAAAEVYISATPEKKAPPEVHLREMFAGIADIIRSRKAHILEERIFAAENITDLVRKVRLEIYGDIDDGVNASILLGKEGILGPVLGAQVHAVISQPAPEVITFKGLACGRILRLPQQTFLTASAISASGFNNASEQARATLEASESILSQFGADLFSIARTWMWLGDILCWYDEFNAARNRFFTERGAIGKAGKRSMPASTGIGLALADGGPCAMDLVAVLEPRGSIQYLQAGGRQGCALEYGSAFSRASKAITPAGQTVFVSGTASIDVSGATIHQGDIAAQIRTTIENVRAVLTDLRCEDKDVVQIVAYCKSTDVEQVLNDVKRDVGWPWVTAICDICRPELLFEIEAAAMPRN